MYIGYLADIVFYTALDNVLTVSDVTRSGSARWEKHNLMLEKPVKQFSGPDVEQITCKILISSSLGQSPDSTVKKLRNYRDTGAVLPFIIGGKPVSQNYFVIMSMSEDSLFTDAYGKTQSIEVSLTLEEYPDKNTVEEKSMLNQYGKKFNKVNTILRRF